MTEPDPGVDKDPTHSPPLPSPLHSLDLDSVVSNEDECTVTSTSTASSAHTDATMLATQLPSAIGGHMFHAPLPSKTPATIQMELQQLKAAPILNPHFRMVQRYIDCLNWYTDICVSSQGPAGMRAWILEVQWFTKSVQRRTYQRMPLTAEERTAIMHFTTYWRQQVHSPYLMSRPEIQVVLIALAETAYH